MHIARATHQESLLQGGALPPPAPGGAAGAGYQEAVPAWEREAAAGAQFQNLEQQQHQQQHQAGGVGGQDVVYASVVAESEWRRCFGLYVFVVFVFVCVSCTLCTGFVLYISCILAI